MSGGNDLSPRHPAAGLSTPAFCGTGICLWQKRLNIDDHEPQLPEAKGRWSFGPRLAAGQAEALDSFEPCTRADRATTTWCSDKSNAVWTESPCKNSFFDVYLMKFVSDGSSNQQSKTRTHSSD